MNGKFTLGNKSTPSRLMDTMPSTMKLMMTIVAKTGRLMEVIEIHMMTPATTGRNLLLRDGTIDADGPHRRAGLDRLAPVGDDEIASREPGENLHARVVAQALGDPHGRRDVVGDAIDDARAVLRRHGFPRYEHCRGHAAGFDAGG